MHAVFYKATYNQAGAVQYHIKHKVVYLKFLRDVFNQTLSIYDTNLAT